MATRPFLLVCDFNAHGGTQTQLLELLAAVDRSRFRPILSTLNLDPALAGRLRVLDVPVWNLALRGALRPESFRALSRLAGRIRSERVSLVHGFLLQGNLTAAVASRLAGVPYLTSVRNLELWKRPHEVMASRWAHRGAAGVTFNSRHVRDLVAHREAIPLQRTRVIYNGLSPEEESPAPREDPPAPWPEGASAKLLCVASFFRKKGHPYLLRSFARVREAHPEAALLLAGEGPERAAAEEQVRGLGLQGRALFTGYREDARALIRSADLLLLSSIEEGMPNVLLEAMAAGRPQVATRVGGVPEAMEDGVTGFLVPPRDPFLMAERIDCLLGDRSLKDRMAAASRERFRRRFTAARMAREHEELYEAVLGGSAS